MEHIITFKTSPVIYAECSCLWGTQLADTKDELVPTVMAHLIVAGVIKGYND